MAHLLHTPQNGQTKIEGQPTNRASAATTHRTDLPSVSVAPTCPPHTDAGALLLPGPFLLLHRHASHHNTNPTTRTARTPGRHTVKPRPKLLTPAAPFHHLLLRRLSVGFLSPPPLLPAPSAQRNRTPPQRRHHHQAVNYPATRYPSRTRAQSSSPTAPIFVFISPARVEPLLVKPPSRQPPPSRRNFRRCALQQGTSLLCSLDCVWGIFILLHSSSSAL